MRYVDRPLCIEHHPENTKDYEHLKKYYGAVGLFSYWCVAKTPKEIFGLLRVKDLIKEHRNASNSETTIQA